MNALYIQAEQAINALFSDTSVEQAETRANLEALAELIETMLYTLDG
jgi:hypothetical protein